jgi:hypothetical protein
MKGTLMKKLRFSFTYFSFNWFILCVILGRTQQCKSGKES